MRRLCLGMYVQLVGVGICVWVMHVFVLKAACPATDAVWALKPTASKDQAGDNEHSRRRFPCRVV